jgi:hypothetical protein
VRRVALLALSWAAVWVVLMAEKWVGCLVGQLVVLMAVWMAAWSVERMAESWVEN